MTTLEMRPDEASFAVEAAPTAQHADALDQAGVLKRSLQWVAALTLLGHYPPTSSSRELVHSPQMAQTTGVAYANSIPDRRSPLE